jgi:hypothetical protein
MITVVDLTEVGARGEACASPSMAGMSSEYRPGREVAKHVTVVVAFLITAPLSLLVVSGSPVLFLLVAALVLFVAVRIVLALVRALR